MANSTSEYLEVQCPNCGARGRIAEAVAGKPLICKRCHFAIPVAGRPMNSDLLQSCEPNHPVADESDSQPMWFFALAGLGASLAATSETVATFGGLVPDTIVRAAMACVAMSAGLLLLAAIGRFFVRLADVSWLHFLANLGWTAMAVILIMMFLVPGWSYAFPFAPPMWVAALSSAKLTVVGAILIKYLTLLLLGWAIAVCLFGRESPVRGLMFWIIASVARLLWIPGQLMLCMVAAPRTWWVRTSYPRKATRLEQRRLAASLDVGRSAETVLAEIRDRLPESLVTPFHNVQAAAAQYQARCATFGKENSAGVMQLVGALAARLTGGGLTTEQKLELEALQTRWTDTQRQLGLAMLVVPIEWVRLIGMEPKVQALRVTVDRLVTVRRNAQEATYYWLPFASLSSRTRRRLTAASTLLAMTMMAVAALMQPNWLASVGTALFRNSSIEIALASLDPWAKEAPGPQPPPVANDSNVSADEPMVTTASEPAPIVCRPLVRAGNKLVWHVPEGEDGPSRLGFVEAEDDRHVYFREAMASEVRRIAKSESKPVPFGIDKPEAWQEQWQEFLVSQVARKISIPEGLCTRGPDASRLAEVKIDLSGYHPEIPNPELHVLRLRMPPISEALAGMQYEIREDLVGTVKVKAAERGYAKVEVPPGLEMQQGDWVFPRVPLQPRKTIALRVQTPAQHLVDKKGEQDQLDALASSMRQRLSELLLRLDQIDVRVEPGVVEPGTYDLLVHVRVKDNTFVTDGSVTLDGKLIAGPVVATISSGQKTDADALASFPTMLVSGQLARWQRKDGQNVVGWFEELSYLGGDVSKLRAEPLPVNAVLGERNRAIQFRNLLEKTIRPVSRSEFLPGSLQWLDGEAAIKESMPFDMYVAWKIARRLYLQVTPVVEEVGAEKTKMIVIGLPQPPIAQRFRVLDAKRTPWYVQQLRRHPLRNQTLFVEDSGPEHRVAGGQQILVSDPPKQLDRVLLHHTIDSRKVQKGLWHEWIAEDVRAKIAMDRWAPVLGDRIMSHLAELGPKKVDNRTLQILGLPHLADGLYDKEVLAQLRKREVSHILHTHMAFDERTDRALAEVKLIDLTGVSPDASEGLPFDAVNESSRRPIYVDELFPKEVPPVFKPPFLMAEGELVRVDFKTESKQDHKNPGQVAAKPFKDRLIGQLVDESKQDKFTIRRVIDQGLMEIPRADVKKIHRFSARDTRNLSNYDELLFVVACEVAMAVCPKAGQVTEINAGRSQATLSLGHGHGIAANMRMLAVRPVGLVSESDKDVMVRDRLPGRVGEIRVDESSPSAAIVGVPPDVEIRLGDVVYADKAPRVQLVVYPLKAVDAAKDLQLKGDKVARDMNAELNHLHIPLLADSSLSQLTQLELERPGVNPQLAAGRGQALGATHVLTGTIGLVPRSQNLELQFVLVNVETGKLEPVGFTAVVHSNLDQTAIPKFITTPSRKP